MTMNYRLTYLLLLPLLMLSSCKSSDDNAVDVTEATVDWANRNQQWFMEVYQTANMEIAKAKAQYPGQDEWQQHCDWRIYRTLLKSQAVAGVPTDCVVCKIQQRGDGDWSPAYTDSVRLYYRGWLMDPAYPVSKDKMTVFSQTYYGEFNPATAAPVAMPVTTTVEGFQTAVQYMVKGDDWLVYIPQELAYKEKASDAIPAYSTLLFNLKIERVHKSGTGMPAWR